MLKQGYFTWQMLLSRTITTQMPTFKQNKSFLNLFLCKLLNQIECDNLCKNDFTNNLYRNWFCLFWFFFGMRPSAKQNHSWYLKRDFRHLIMFLEAFNGLFHGDTISYISKIAPLCLFWRCGAASAHTCHDNWEVKTKCLNHHFYRQICFFIQI